MADNHPYRLPGLSLDRPIATIMILVALLAVGSIAYNRIPLSLLPSGIEGDRLWVWIPYPNASPEEVEQVIVQPLEEALSTLSQVEKIRSRAMRERGTATIRFKPDADMGRAWAELAERMDRLRPELPDVEFIQIGNWGDADEDEIMWMNVRFEEGYSDPHYFVESHLRPALQRLDGVGTVRSWGSSEEILIELDEDRVRGHNADVGLLVNQLRDQNFTISSGFVHEGGRKIQVRSLGRFRSEQEISDIVLDAGRDLRLADIASVGRRTPEKLWVNRTNSQEAMWVGIQRVSNGNIVAISRQVRAKLEELKEQPRFHGFQVKIFWDQGEHVLRSLDNLKSSGLWGGFFAALVLLFFLRNVRMTAIITLAIPLSILATTTALYFIGWSLNIATMMGLMLSLGLVVDNAIVIVENIYRKRQGGTEPRAASISGAGEVGMAVTMATLTTVVVFLPLILMSDDHDFSFWMLRIGMPVIVGLVASLFIALIFIPLAAQRLSSAEAPPERKMIVGLRGLYLRCLRWVLTHRLDTLIVVVLAMASIHFPMEGIKRTDQQERRRSHIYMRFYMPPGLSMENMDRFISGVEDTLHNHREDYNIDVVRSWFEKGRGGGVGITFEEGERLEWYEVAFENIVHGLGLRPKPHLDYEEIVEDLKERIHIPPGTTMIINWNREDQDAALSLNLYGHNTRVLMGLVDEVARRLLSIPGLEEVRTDMAQSSPELQVRLDRDRLERYGVDPQAVSRQIGARWPSTRLHGVELGRFRTEEGRDIVIRLRLEEEDREGMSQLRNLTFATRDSAEVSLETLATFYVEQGLDRIRRFDRQTMITVSARASKDDAAKLFEQVDQAMEGFEMPRGYRWDKGARYVRLEEVDRSRKFALIMAVTFVFLLMGVLFECFLLPLSVIVSIPFSFLGVYWALYLTSTPQDTMSAIGAVILIGVVVNNAIVLIDLVNRLRQEGMGRFEALVEAGRHRFRPILMTTFTTICGLIPMAVGNEKMIGMNYAPLGRTMMGGLLASMVLTLLVVPLFYTFFDDLRLWGRRMAAAFSRPPEGRTGRGASGGAA